LAAPHLARQLLRTADAAHESLMRLAQEAHRERQTLGIGELGARDVCGGTGFSWNATLADVARSHAAYMASVAMLTGEDPEGNIGDRLDAAGTSYSSAGEIYGRLGESVDALVGDWWENVATNQYVTSCEHSEAGVGVAPSDGPGAAYVTLTMISP
jgi:hypothetical protein